MVGKICNILVAFYLKSIVLKKLELPHMLFYGAPGVGKTSAAVALARDLFGPLLAGHFLELNASNDRGIETIRGPVLTFSRTAGPLHNQKIILLDEADFLTADAQAALRRIMEIWGHRVRFIFTANNLSKIDPAIRSRCVELYFKRLSNEAVTKILRKKSISNPMALADCIAGDYRKILQIQTGQKINTLPNYSLIAAIILGQRPLSESCIQKFCNMSPDITILCRGLLAKLKAQSVIKKLKLSVYFEISKAEWRVKAGANLELQIYAMIHLISNILAK